MRTMTTKLALAVALALTSELGAVELLLSDFNNTGFSFTYGGFEQTVGSTSTRLRDPSDGWGAGQRIRDLNLASLMDGRLVVDFVPNAGHQTDSFKVHLNDSSGLSGRWSFNTSGLVAGQPTQLVSLNTISNPDQVFNGSGFVDTPPDLSQITSWAIEGLFGSPEPFDINFDNLKISTDAVAPPPYAGFDPNAPWRAQAATMIDQNRKGDVNVQVLTASGVPVQGAQVSINMVEHEYGFGSAMRGRTLVGSLPGDIAYQQKAAELFNAGTFFNDLKWPPREGNWGPSFTPEITSGALDWAAANGITMRGHAMVWPSYDHLPNSMRARLDEYYDASTTPSRKTQLENEMRQAVLDHIADIGSATAGKVTDWDVVNEIRDNHELQDILGDSVMVDWFNAAAAANPSAELYLNEFLILASSGSTDSGPQQSLFDSISYLQSNGAPIGGLGLQSHFNDSLLTGPEQIWQILDRFDAFGLDMKITEYTYSSDNDAWREQFTRDFLTAVFAHAGTDEFLTWGSSILENAADPSVEISPVDQAILDLVFDEWWTELSAATDSNGELTDRVIRGLHDVTVEWQGKTYASQQVITEDGLQLVVVVPGPGDFNGDGSVDTADYTVWRDGLGTSYVLSDYDVWVDNFGATYTSASAAATPVPEPATALLSLLVIAFVGGWRVAGDDAKRRPKGITTAASTR